jgi:hypothetical protein
MAGHRRFPEECSQLAVRAAAPDLKACSGEHVLGLADGCGSLAGESRSELF